MGLAAENRLRKPAEFEHVLKSAGRSGSKSGGRASDGLLLLAAVPNRLDRQRVGLSVSNRVGGAVVRNRVKRRLREIFRTSLNAEKDASGDSWDFVVTARPAAAAATYNELERSVTRLVSKVTGQR